MAMEFNWGPVMPVTLYFVPQYEDAKLDTKLPASVSILAETRYNH